MSVSGKVVGYPSSLRVHSLRLSPGEEIKTTLLRYAEESGLRAPFILSCVGSLTRATIRYAAQPTADSVVNLVEKMEICSLVGTLGSGGHLHIVLGREDGSTVSGHVIGNLDVFTTAEIMLGECEDVVFNRKFDSRTGFDELDIVPRNSFDELDIVPRNSFGDYPGPRSPF